MTKRDRLMLLAVLAVAMIGGAWMVLIQPQRKAAKEAQAQVATAQQQLQEAQQSVAAGKAAEQAYRRDRVAIVKLGRVVPESDDVPTLLVQLSALGKRYKVDFTSWTLDSSGGGAASVVGTTPADPASGSVTTTPADTDKKPTSADAVAPLYPPGSSEIPGGLGRTAVKIQLSGTYFNLERFLRAVQHFAIVSAEKTRADGRLMLVDAFSYSTGDQSGTKLSAELSASIYFAPPVETPKVGGPGAAGAPSAASPASASGSSSTSTGPATIGGVE